MTHKETQWKLLTEDSKTIVLFPKALLHVGDDDFARQVAAFIHQRIIILKTITVTDREPEFGEQLIDVGDAIYVRHVSEGGEAARVDYPPHTNDDNELTERVEHRHIAEQWGAKEGGVGLVEGGGGQQVQREIHHPLDEWLEWLQRVCNNTQVSEIDQ